MRKGPKGTPIVSLVLRRQKDGSSDAGILTGLTGALKCLESMGIADFPFWKRDVNRLYQRAIVPVGPSKNTYTCVRAMIILISRVIAETWTSSHNGSIEADDEIK